MARSISPYLFYEDVGAALDWLAKAFGFRETTRMPGPEGQIWHAEMELGDGSIMLGYPGEEYENPKRRGGTPSGSTSTSTTSTRTTRRRKPRARRS